MKKIIFTLFLLTAVTALFASAVQEQTNSPILSGSLVSRLPNAVYRSAFVRIQCIEG